MCTVPVESDDDDDDAVINQMICRRTQLGRSTAVWRRKVEWDQTRWIHN